MRGVREVLHSFHVDFYTMGIERAGTSTLVYPNSVRWDLRWYLLALYIQGLCHPPCHSMRGTILFIAFLLLRADLGSCKSRKEYPPFAQFCAFYQELKYSA